MSIPR